MRKRKLNQLLNNVYYKLDQLKENKHNFTEEDFEKEINALEIEGNEIISELQELDLRTIKRTGAMIVLLIVIWALISL